MREKLPLIEPDLVIHALYWNDFMNAHPPVPGKEVLTPEGNFVWENLRRREGLLTDTIYYLISRSSFLTLLKNAAADLSRGGKDELSAYGRQYQLFINTDMNEGEWKPLDNFYKQLKSLQEEYGFRLVIVVIPVIGLVEDQKGLTHPYRIYVRHLLEEMEIQYLDGLELWIRGKYGKKTFLSGVMDDHLNADGYRLLSDAVADRIVVEFADDLGWE